MSPMVPCESAGHLLRLMCNCSIGCQAPRFLLGGALRGAKKWHSLGFGFQSRSSFQLRDGQISCEAGKSLSGGLWQSGNDHRLAPASAVLWMSGGTRRAGESEAASPLGSESDQQSNGRAAMEGIKHNRRIGLAADSGCRLALLQHQDWVDAFPKKQEQASRMRMDSKTLADALTLAAEPAAPASPVAKASLIEPSYRRWSAAAERHAHGGIAGEFPCAWRTAVATAVPAGNWRAIARRLGKPHAVDSKAKASCRGAASVLSKALMV